MRLQLIEVWNVSSRCRVQFVSYNAISTLLTIQLKASNSTKSNLSWTGDVFKISQFVAFEET